jgi:hypothetical protein
MPEATAAPIALVSASEDVRAALSWHDGDVLATIATLIEDCRHPREQLAHAEASMSVGFARGWTPVYERSA